jgi:hypothetical protein
VTCPWRRLRITLPALVAFGCATSGSPPAIAPTLISADGDALAVDDALEALIDDGRDTPSDREFAYASVLNSRDDGGPETPYARAAVTGRFIQQKGLRAAALVSYVERNATESRARDPEFRNGAATRILGTLYVMAPASLLSQGNSELGVELLEALTKEYPDDLENHLRLAEAYLALGDTKPALPHLCLCLAEKLELRRSDQLLLNQLVEGAGMPGCLEVVPAPR